MGDTDLRFYLSILWRRMPYVIGITIAILAIGVAIVYYLPPVYRATSKILIESPQIPEQLARSTVPFTGLEQIQIIEQRMMTKNNLLDLARKFNIYDDDGQLSETDIVEDMASRTSFEQIQLGIPQASATAVFAVSFEAEDPNLAADIAREITTQILQENTQLRMGRASYTQQFFEDSVKKLAVELVRLEAELLKFKTEKGDALPDSLEYRRSEQARQQERLVLLQREEATLRDRRSSHARISENKEAGAGGRIAPTPEEQTLEQLRRTLAEQRGIYSDQSPNMVALRSRIEKLQKEVQSQRALTNASGQDRRQSEVDVELAEIDGRLSFIDHERTAITRILAELKKSILATPANEIVLNSLERNYKNTQLQYDSAVARLAEASTGKQIEQLSKGYRLTVIEMATPPDKRTSSRRLTIVAGTGIAGLGMGLGFVFLLELLNRTIRRPFELVKELGIRPLATIPYIQTPNEAFAKKIAISLALLVAVGVPASMLVVHNSFLPVHLWLDSVVAGQR